MGLHVYADRDHPLPEGASPDEPVCFEVPSSYEITAGEKKLVGSAQARRYMGVLQHGTLPLTGDVSQIVMALNFESEAERLRAAARVAARATTISTVAGREVSWEEAAECLTTAFAQTLNLDLSLGDLTPGEADRAVQLLTEKYGSNSWTERIAFTPVKAV
jgi:lipoate-protein ligase A